MVDAVEESEAINNQCESPPIVPGNSNTQTVDNTTSELTAEPATNDEMEGNEHASKLLQSLVSRLAAYCSELSSGIAAYAAEFKLMFTRVQTDSTSTVDGNLAPEI